MPKPTIPTSLALTFLLGSCSLFPTQEPSPRTSLARHACQDPEFTPLVPADDSQSSPRPVLAGGSVIAGDFLISLWLSCDPGLSADDPESPDYSEVRFLGIRTEWQYLGKPLQHDSTSKLTANGQGVSASGAGPGVTYGEVNVHVGNVRTESGAISRAIQSSQPVDFVLTVSAPEPLAAALLRVTFKEGPDGFQLASAEVHEIDPGSP